jgi:hypothetical protein
MSFADGLKIKPIKAIAEPYSAVNKQEFFEASPEFVQKYNTSSHDRSKRGQTHGRETSNRATEAQNRAKVSGNNVGGNGVRKVESYLPPR